MNGNIDRLLCSGVSQRRIARLLKLNRKTVVRKLLLLAEQAKIARLDHLASLSEVPALQFDEMESFEHTKCKPLSIPLAVLPKSRKILAFRVGRMPAKGPLALISRRKYGPRADDRPELARSLLAEVREALAKDVEISTDQNPHYPGWIKSQIPSYQHQAYPGKRGCITGQGELKKTRWDPLFDLNHTCAMIRANVNRLFRHTWCTTKRPDRLAAHLELYVRYHNTVLTA